MSEPKIKASKVKVHAPPSGTGDGRFHVYIFDVFHRAFLPGKIWENIEKATSYRRHEQERIYAEQEADPELFDLPFISSDPDLLTRVEQDPEYRSRLMRDLTSEARGRIRKR